MCVKHILRAKGLQSKAANEPEYYKLVTGWVGPTFCTITCVHRSRRSAAGEHASSQFRKMLLCLFGCCYHRMFKWAQPHVQSYSCWVCTRWQNIILIFRCFLWNGEGSCWGKFILLKFLCITLSFARLQLCLCSIVYFKIERIQYIVEKERVTAIIQEFKNLGHFLLLHLSLSICVGLVLDGAFFNPVRA